MFKKEKKKNQGLTRFFFLYLLLLYIIAQARKERNIVNKEPTRFIQIDHLPITTTMEDIRKLAREALPNGDQSINEGKCFIFILSFADVVVSLLLLINFKE